MTKAELQKKHDALVQAERIIGEAAWKAKDIPGIESPAWLYNDTLKYVTNALHDAADELKKQKE
jgi:hypothetical protein